MQDINVAKVTKSPVKGGTSVAVYDESDIRFSAICNSNRMPELLDIEAGDVLVGVDIKINGRYHDIMSVQSVRPGPNHGRSASAAPPPGGPTPAGAPTSPAAPAVMANPRAQAFITAMETCGHIISALVMANAKEEEWNRALGPGTIKVFHGALHSSLGVGAPKPRPHFRNASEMVNYYLKLGMDYGDIKVSLSINDVSEIHDLEQAAKILDQVAQSKGGAA